MYRFRYLVHFLFSTQSECEWDLLEPLSAEEWLEVFGPREHDSSPDRDASWIDGGFSPSGDSGMSE